MKVSILGAGGFIGSHLVEHLLRDARYEIRGIDIASEKLDGIAGDRFDFKAVDIGDSEAQLEELVRWADVVVDLVAYANPSLYVRSPLEVFELNFMKNLEIVRLCVEHSTKLVQFSTSEIYGHPVSELYQEDASPLTMGPITKQRWIYASAKQLLERVIHAHGLEDELDYVIFRPFNVIGPRLDYLVPAGSRGGPRVFAHFMSALLTDGPMFLVNGGEVHRTFTHIDDAVRGIITTLHHPDAVHNAFNLGNPGNETTIVGLAELMRGYYTELTGKTWNNLTVDISGDEFYGEGYEDTNRVPPDISKLQALGWTPEHDLERTLKDSMAYYIEHHDPAQLLATASA